MENDNWVSDIVVISNAYWPIIGIHFYRYRVSFSLVMTFLATL